MDTKNDRSLPTSTQMGEAIRMACDRRLGVLDSHFMCRSVGTLPCKPAISAAPTDSVEKVLALLRENKTGCVVIVDGAGVLQGIFSERDFILKISGDFQNRISAPISEYMTRDPMVVTSDCTLAYALNLMSQGGFRHLPLVNEAGHSNGVLSVKDVVDVIVGQFIDDVMALDTVMALDSE